MTRVLATIGAGLVGLGLLIGLTLPVHAEGVSCGTALHGSDEPEVADLADTLAGAGGPRTGVIGGVSAACDSARGRQRTITWVIVGAGVVALLGAAAAQDGRRGQVSRGAATSRSV